MATLATMGPSFSVSARLASRPEPTPAQRDALAAAIKERFEAMAKSGGQGQNPTTRARLGLLSSRFQTLDALPSSSEMGQDQTLPEGPIGLAKALYAGATSLFFNVGNLLKAGHGC